MYSDKVLKILSDSHVEAGDSVSIVSDGKSYEGIIIPATEMGNPDYLVIKLKNGYNIGVKTTSSMKITKKDSAKKEFGKKKSVLKLKFDESKPKVSLITTGGTITSRVDYETGGVTSLMEADELLSNTPELADIINVADIVRPFTRMSESMGFEDYSELGKVVEEELNKTKAVIVTHGTDTLHYTAAALSFMFHDCAKPIVLTAAQKSSDRPSSDASVNLVCSAHVAASDIGETGVCMHATSSDDYCYFTRGTKVRKMHTSMRNTFRPINDLPLAKINRDGKIEKLSDYRERFDDKKVKAVTGFEEKTALVKFAPNMSPDIIDYYAGKGYKGIVVEATGLGHVAISTRDPKMSWLNSVKSAVDSGVVVCFAAQTLYGRLDPFVYAEARKMHEAGVTYLEDMMPETAYIKLAWLLKNEKKNAAELMLRNYAGELNSRLKPETFLY